MQVVIASTSTYRQQLFARLGIAFECAAPNVDESRRADESPRALATRLARAKAEDVARAHPDACVIGADQVIALGEMVFGKPGSAAAAEAQLQQLAGASHQLITAVCVLVGDQSREASMVHEMTMRNLTADEIREYVALEQPFDCAGAYKIEGAGIRLFESLRGDDYTNIVGLPLTLVHRMLRDIGAV